MAKTKYFVKEGSKMAQPWLACHTDFQKFNFFRTPYRPRNI